MPLSREEHEALINELMGEDVTHSRKAEILQNLRADNTEMHESVTNLSSERDSLRTERDDLSLSNSRLFRQLGANSGGEEIKEKEEKKEFSETVTLESLGI